MKLISILALSIALAGCATFENHKGEKFPFSIKLIQSDKPAPTVMVSHGGSCRVSQDEMWASRFRSWGYNVVLLDHCTARGIGPHTGVEPPTLSPNDRVNDYIATAEWIKTQKWHAGKVAVFGISRGGEAVLRAADPRMNRVRRGSEGQAEIDLYVALYPACTLVPKSPRAPLLIMHGEADNLAVFATCAYENYKHQNLFIKTYPGASHGFDVPGPEIRGSNRFLGSFISAKYDEKAAAQSEKDTKEFFELNLK